MGNSENSSKWFIYIVLCADGSYYCGITTDLSRGVLEHNGKKGAKYTRSRRPVHLAWSLACPDRGSASKIEAKIKKMTRKEKEVLIKEGIRSWSN